MQCELVLGLYLQKNKFEMIIHIMFEINMLSDVDGNLEFTLWVHVL